MNLLRLSRRNTINAFIAFGACCLEMQSSETNFILMLIWSNQLLAFHQVMNPLQNNHKPQFPYLSVTTSYVVTT